jgi:hypothetical protein
MTAWPAIVSTTAMAAASRVSTTPVQGALSREPGQSSHQNAIIATPASPNVDIGPRISNPVAALPVPSARTKKITAVSSRPPSPAQGWAASRSRRVPATSTDCRLGGAVSTGRSGKDTRRNAGHPPAAAVELPGRCASRCSMAIGSSRARYPVAW